MMNLLGRANHTAKAWARASGIGASVIVVCLEISGFSIQVSQPKKMNAELQPFVGTWQAKFKGKVFQTIKLNKNQDKLTGTVSHADISVDPKTGELTDVDVLDGSDAIVEATLTNGTLLITEQDGTQFEMKVTGTDEAELHIVIPPDAVEEVPAAKPWKLERVKPRQSKS